MGDYVPDGITVCAFCGAPAPYFIGVDGEQWVEGQEHRAECPDAPPEECPF